MKLETLKAMTPDQIQEYIAESERRQSRLALRTAKKNLPETYFREEAARMCMTADVRSDFYKLFKREVMREFVKQYCAEHGLSAEAEGEEE